MIRSESALRNKYAGCLLGAAIGDALGKQNEGQKREDILKKGYITDYGRTCAGSPGDKLRPGQYTDDTEQMIVLARSIIDSGGFDVTDFACRIAQWGAEALSDPVRMSLLGPSSSAAIARLNSGATWRDSGSDFPSCGSAMRAAPLGLFYNDLDEIQANAALSSMPTHSSRGAMAGAVAVAVGVRCSLHGMECSGIIGEVSGRASKYDSGLGKKIELSFKKKARDPGEVFHDLGTSYLVSETVPCAFYCFSRHFDHPENAVIEAANAGGDTDSIACITGALCGARHGMAAFPEKWIKGLENREQVMQVADKLFEKSVRVSDHQSYGKSVNNMNGR